MFKRFLGLVLVLGYVYSQVVNKVQLINHTDYMVDVLGQVARILEEREWCNFKVSEFSQNINETIHEEEVTGTVTYKNGFVVSIEWVDILASSVQQVWTWNVTDATGSVAVRGTIRMHDVRLGHDVVADVDNEVRRYTATYVHPMVSVAISIIFNTHTHLTTVTAVGTVDRSITNRVRFMPTDNMTDVYTVLFDPTLSNPEIMLWATEKFEPVTLDVINQIPFPTICYNCH